MSSLQGVVEESVLVVVVVDSCVGTSCHRVDVCAEITVHSYTRVVRLTVHLDSKYDALVWHIVMHLHRVVVYRHAK